ncbi:MAG TPA: calcium/sodium antiporter [Solirubrobacterales bacterium]|nr:calcium/sodium antiporter [Solirubrobacterales bacterium]
MILDLLLVAVGVAMLARAGDYLVDCSVAIADKARLTPAVVGLTVVAAGTSAPELFVSVTAALAGSPAIAVGNAVGSNVANIGLVLGAAALIAPIPIARAILRFEYPVMIAASLALPLACYGGELGRVAGMLFVAAIAWFLVYSIRLARLEGPGLENVAELVPESAAAMMGRSPLALTGGVVLGIVGLAAGAHLLVVGASGVALALGVSERVVGLTVVAFGTSLPELVATLAAAVKRHHAMAIANIVGSNIFNILLILGVTATIRPIRIEPQLLWQDIPVMLGFALALGPVVARGRGLSRRTGAVLVVLYLVYIVWLARAPGV